MHLGTCPLFSFVTTTTSRLGGQVSWHRLVRRGTRAGRPAVPPAPSAARWLGVSCLGCGERTRAHTGAGPPGARRRQVRRRRGPGEGHCVSTGDQVT